MSEEIIICIRLKSSPFFSGYGGLALGFHLEGYETVWANDFAEWAVKSFKCESGDVIKYGDITKINPYTDKSILDCDMVLSGFKCQDFSIIWRQPGRMVLEEDCYAC